MAVVARLFWGAGMSNGMCARCGVIPAVTGANRTRGYCAGCESLLNSQAYQRRTGKAEKRIRATRDIWSHARDPSKVTPPVDWREVLRKAEEPKA
jgi:hypothetical protein